MDAPGFIPSLIGAPLSAGGGAITGVVEDVLLDAASHRPVWLLVRLSDEAPAYTFVPAQRMASRADAVVVPFDETLIRAAPVRLAAPPASCRREHVAALIRHYAVRVPAGEARSLRARPARVSRVAA
jgi:hypothetical protein